MAMAMAMAQPFWNQKKKKMPLFTEAMLELCYRKGALATKINATVEGGSANGDGYDSCCGIDMSGDAIRLCKQGQLKEALHILHVMSQRGIRPDSSTYGFLLHECLIRKALPEGKLIHAHMIDMGFKPDIVLGNKLLIMYAKCRSLADARLVLDEMPERNVVSWTVVIAAYARQGYHREALTLFYQMQRTDVQPNQFTFASVLPACANLGALQHGKKVHEDIINTGFQSNIFVGNALVDMYAKCGRIEDARQVFDKMPERNVVSWNAMIAGYGQNEHVDEALKLFQKMPQLNVVSWTSMVAGYARSGHVDEALRLFQKMPERNTVSWTALIAGCAQNGHVDAALDLFQEMPERDVVSWNVIIAGFVHNGLVDKAMKLFQKTPERNEVSWNGIIAGCEQNGYFNEALNLFRHMQLTGVKPVSVTFSSVLPACGNLAAQKHGKEVHNSIIRNGFQSDIFVGSALVDMYAKCGSIEDACHVFGKMPERDVVSWNAMIVGYAMHGYAKEAVQLFEQMQHSGKKPDHVTFVGILSACCHAGLVDDGWQYFDCMSQDYHITPAVEHYCCMVDLLCRAGLLDEAHDFINKMPVKPNAAVWGSLLGGCRIHKNAALGELVAEHLLNLEPENAANYVLLSNIYAAANKLDDIEKLQKMRKDRRIKKSPGCSWIEINNKVHYFLVRDRSHPEMHKIYEELENLSQQMEEAGYKPNMNLVFSTE